MVLPTGTNGGENNGSNPSPNEAPRPAESPHIRFSLLTNMTRSAEEHQAFVNKRRRHDRLPHVERHTAPSEGAPTNTHCP